MTAIRKEMAAKPVLVARPIARPVSAEELFSRTMKRYPKTMARLGE